MSASPSSPGSLRRLPDQPNLEQLKKQAKDLLRRYLLGDPDATAEVSRFERNPSPDFALHDAQRVLARAYGFGSWPKLKAFVDGVDIGRFAEAVQKGDVAGVRAMLASRPELVAMDRSENDEHRAIHYAVLRRDAPMVRLLMEAGSDARKGIFPHREATSAWALAHDRGYAEIVGVIEEEERQRREEMSCINATVSPAQDQVSAALRAGDRAAAMQLLAADVSLLHACDREGRTPLHVAAGRCDRELMEWMLARCVNVSKKDPAGLTPLDHAALAADPRNECATTFPVVAQLLLRHGADFTLRGVVALGDRERAHALIRTGPEVLHEISGRGGLLSLAVNHHQREMARLLLDLGVDVDERIRLQELEEPVESWGMPLWYAALANDLEMARLLLDRGADPNANVYASGWPLRNAWQHKDDSVKRLLLERGAKPQPYMVAESHDIDAAKKLLEQSPHEDLAQELAWSAADAGCAEIVELALAHLRWPRSDARWHWVLIQPIRGASEESTRNEGHFASMGALLRHGIDPNVSRFGQTALHFAAAHHTGLSGKERARFASMLIDAGADLKLRDDLLRSTPLGWACRWGRVELAEFLIARGALVDEADAEPWATPVAWARKVNHAEMVALLERARNRV